MIRSPRPCRHRARSSLTHASRQQDHCHFRSAGLDPRRWRRPAIMSNARGSLPPRRGGSHEQAKICGHRFRAGMASTRHRASGSGETQLTQAQPELALSSAPQANVAPSPVIFGSAALPSLMTSASLSQPRPNSTPAAKPTSAGAPAKPFQVSSTPFCINASPVLLLPYLTDKVL